MDEYEELLRKCNEAMASRIHTVGDVVDRMTDEQRYVMYFLIGQAIQEERKLMLAKLRILLEHDG